jgi:hypothetical protein
MSTQLLRFAALALAAGTVAWPVQAATLTVNIPGCTALALTGTGPNYQVSCTQQLQSCIVNATPATPQGGTVVQLAVACTPAATSVTWQASRDCAVPTASSGNPLAATATEPSGRSCVYTATADAGGSGATTVVWQGPGTQPPPPPPNAPTGCAITRTPANGSLPAAGGNVSMSGACTGGGSVTAYNWRRNVTSGWSTAQAPTDNLPANTGSSAVTYTYGLTACAGSACAAEVVTTFTVAGAAAAGFCSQYQNVVIGPDFPLSTGGTPIETAAYGGLMADGVYVGRLVIPTNVNQGGLGRVSFVEYIDPPAERLMTISTQPCDFRGGYGVTDPTSASAPILWSNGQTPQIIYQFTGPSSNAVLQAGQIYYISIRNANWYNGAPSCLGTYCNGRFNTAAP